MGKLYESLGRKALFLLDAETAHHISLKALEFGFGTFCKPVTDLRLRQNIAGLEYLTPIGMAAGYDKNGHVPYQLLKLGFGFTEVGTVTPLPQAGNPCPRIFRLPEDGAIINRFGFNSEGHKAVLARLEKRDNKKGIIGVNIGANKDSKDRIDDYVKGIETFYNIANYFTVNISSPNTSGLRDLQTRENLAELLKSCMGKRNELAVKYNRSLPIFLKISPDLNEQNLDDIASEARLYKLDGMIISNTTLSRTGLKNTTMIGETGGLSGPPLSQRSNIILAKMRQRMGRKMPIIGVGGVYDVNSATEKIQAGADLVQLYTGLIYKGPTLPLSIARGLSIMCDKHGLTHISEIRDQKLEQYARQTIPD